MKRFLEAKTILQTREQYDPRVHIPVDGVMVHPHNELPHNPAPFHASWAQKTACVGRMFFSDSDDLNEYWSGKWDGESHEDEVEMKSDGEPMRCSDIRPYLVATDGWINYLYQRKVSPSLDLGTAAIIPEEPIGHTFTGYEKETRRMYEALYGEPWEDPKQSPLVHTRLAEMKARLYYKLESELCTQTKQRAAQEGRPIDFVVPIHSIFSNKANQLTAPLGLSLQNPEFDGFIGQIWTGPIRWCLSQYDSDDKSFFSSAFALYEYFVQLVNGTGKKLWLLTDPVEDDPHHTWEEFRTWYQEGVAAMLMMREVNSYEVMPWPERIFLPTTFTPGIDDQVDNPTLPDYFTLVLSITQALQDMPEGGEWIDGTDEIGLGIAVADSAMWVPHEENCLQGHYGLRIPLLERGVLARNFVMERAVDPDYADQFKVVVLSYEEWWPYDDAMQDHLTGWVQRGGTLIMLGQGGGGGRALLDRLDNNRGAGMVLGDETSPRAFADPIEFETVYRPLLEAAGISCEHRDGFAMRRGDYMIARALNKELPMAGHFVDVFSPDLSVCEDPAVAAGTCGLFKQFDPASEPSVIHSTCRLMEQSFEEGVLRFTICGPLETDFTARVSLGDYTCEEACDSIRKENGTLKLTGANSPGGVTVELNLILKEELACV